MERVNMPALCNQTGFDAAKSGKALAVGSNISFVAGALASGTAVVLLLTETPPEKPAARARGRRMTADVLEAGPQGAIVGVRGVW
jgi:hypothetical protein